MVVRFTRLVGTAVLTLLASAAAMPASALAAPPVDASAATRGDASPAEQRYPAARGWSDSELGLRVAGPNQNCTYLVWLPADAPAATAEVKAAGRTHTVVAGQEPQRVTTPKPCNSPRTLEARGEQIDTADVVGEQLPLPSPQFSITTRITGHSSSALGLRGTVNSRGLALPPTQDEVPAISPFIRELRVAFLDYARTTSRTCVWLTERAGHVATVDRRTDPTCQRAPAAAASAMVRGNSWNMRLASRGNPGRLVLTDRYGSLRYVRTIPKAGRAQS